jgi:hypothetical protein
MAGTYPRNNPGKFANKTYAKANCLNAVAFDKPSDLDGNEESNFNGSQYNPDDDPHMRGMNPMTGLLTTRLLVSARFDSMSRMNFGVFMPSARRIATNASQTP